MERKQIFYQLTKKIPSYSGYYYRQRIQSLILMYRCVLYRDKFNLNVRLTADRLGISEGRVYELLRKYEREKTTSSPPVRLSG